ncbi:MAG: hypothetical protein ACI4VQ_06280 [Clostridia bacterium]
MICETCKKKYSGTQSKWCSRSCYYKSYYKKNRETLLKKQKEWHKNNYKYHPLNLKKKTKEEKREYRKKYYQDHLEYFKEKNRDYYLKHKKDKEYIERHKAATKKYIKRRKELEEKKEEIKMLNLLYQIIIDKSVQKRFDSAMTCNMKTGELSNKRLLDQCEEYLTKKMQKLIDEINGDK